MLSRISRRRARHPDPLASTESVRAIIAQLSRQCPEILPKSEQQIIRILESVRHCRRRPDVTIGRGRPRRWSRENVTVVAQKLEKILEQKAGGRISLSSFVSLYLRILRYPADVARALNEGEINIREASYLARLSPERMNTTAQEARQIRAEVLKAHLLSNGSQELLRRRVKSLLGESPEMESTSNESVFQKSDRLLEHNPSDARHLFYEEIRLLTDALRQVEPEELKGKVLSNLLQEIDKLLNMLQRTKRLKQSRGRSLLQKP